MLTDINILAYNITFIDASSCTTQDLPHTNVRAKSFFVKNEDPSLAQKMEQIINIANKQNKKTPHCINNQSDCYLKHRCCCIPTGNLL